MNEEKNIPAHVLIEQEANNGMNIDLRQVERREERELARVSLSLLRMDKASYKEIGSALRQLAKSLGAGRGVIHLHKQADQVTAIIFDMADPEDSCRDCGRSCDGYRCEECEDAYRDATSCPTCSCPNTDGDICDGCDEINREEAGDDE